MAGASTKPAWYDGTIFMLHRFKVIGITKISFVHNFCSSEILPWEFLKMTHETKSDVFSHPHRPFQGLFYLNMNLSPHNVPRVLQCVNRHTLPRPDPASANSCSSSMEVVMRESPSILQKPWKLSWRMKPAMDLVSKIFWGPLFPSTSFLKSFSAMTMQFPSSAHQIDLKWRLPAVFQSLTRKERAEEGLVLAEISEKQDCMMAIQDLSGKTRRSFSSVRGFVAAPEGAPISPSGWLLKAEASHQAGSSQSEDKDVSSEDISIATCLFTAWLQFAARALSLMSQAQSCQSAGWKAVAPAALKVL